MLWRSIRSKKIKQKPNRPMQLKSRKFSAKQFMLLPLTSTTNINNLKHPAIDGTEIQKENATSQNFQPRRKGNRSHLGFRKVDGSLRGTSCLGSQIQPPWNGSQLRLGLVVEIYHYLRGFGIHPYWCRISEPSTVALKKRCFFEYWMLVSFWGAWVGPFYCRGRTGSFRECFFLTPPKLSKHVLWKGMFFSNGFSSSNHQFSEDMLVFRGVLWLGSTPHPEWWWLEYYIFRRPGIPMNFHLPLFPG